MIAKKDLNQSEFRVFSQWGEDGIIQALINNIDNIPECFVEFGVEDYTEANTRFLCGNNNWSGLIIDGSPKNISKIQSDTISWSSTVNSHCEFITAENINNLITTYSPSQNVGLLSIDIDGNDYWIWKSITCINPIIVICEYNSHFGPNASVTIPYDPNYHRSMHSSNIFYGASITALVELGNSKGYRLVYGNKAGNNLFFVKNNIAPSVQEISILDAYTPAKFREHKSSSGQLSLIDFDDRVASISNELIFELHSNQLMPLKNALSNTTPSS